MKHTNILPALFVFVLAIGSVLATSVLDAQARSRIQVTGDQGSVVPGATCQIIDIKVPCAEAGNQLCDLPQGTAWFRYFSDTQCIIPLEKP